MDRSFEQSRSTVSWRPLNFLSSSSFCCPYIRSRRFLSLVAASPTKSRRTCSSVTEKAPLGISIMCSIQTLQCIITNYNTLCCIITIEQAQCSSQDMNDNTMVDLVQGITHVHLKQTEIRHQPKRIEEQVKSCTRMLLFIVTISRSLGVRPAVIAELHHGTASSWYSC